MLNDSIRIFLTVVEKKSFSKAAKALFLTQPAISFQIQMLEDYYGTKLFDRVNRTINLTAAGELLLRYAEEMTKMQSQLEREMQELTGTVKGKMLIGASTTIGEYILPYVMGDFKKENPDVEMHLEIANTEEIEKRLTESSLDFGIVEGPVSNKDINQEKFLDDELVLITPPDHPWAKLQSISVFELGTYPFITREKGSGTRYVMERALQEAGFNLSKLNISMELGSTSAIKAAVQSGLGISIISKCAAKEKVKLGLISKATISDLRLSRQFTIITHKKKFRTQATEEFLSFLRSELVKDIICE